MLKNYGKGLETSALSSYSSYAILEYRTPFPLPSSERSNILPLDAKIRGLIEIWTFYDWRGAEGYDYYQRQPRKFPRFEAAITDVNFYVLLPVWITQVLVGPGTLAVLAGVSDSISQSISITTEQDLALRNCSIIGWC